MSGKEELLSNSRKSYNWIAILFHWSIALLFVYLFYLAITMLAMDDSDLKWSTYDQHKQFGLLVGILVLFRILWKFTTTGPDYPEGHALWQQRLASATHVFLYLIMILFPISGYMMSMSGGHGIDFFGLDVIDVMGESEVLSDISHTIHYWLEKVTYVIVALHALAALYHHFVFKNNVLKGMLISNRVK